MSDYDTTFHPEKTHSSAWIADGAVVVGDVTLHANVNVWFTAVLRGDIESLTIGENTNIQDGAVCHADPGYPLIIGEGVTVGHRVGNNSLIGMGAIILNGATIGNNCIVGAGALVTQNKVFPDNSLILGSPAKVVRELSPEEIAMNRQSASHYVSKARAFKSTP